MALEHVLSPLRLGPLTVRNRVATTAHMTGYAENGLVSDTLVEYLTARARGGVGLLITEAGAVHPTYRPASYRLYRDDVGPGLARLAAAVHAEGAVLIGQANHGGAASPPLPDGRPAFSASDNDGLNGAPARAMTHAEIEEIQDAFVRATRVMSDAGLDGCEVHGAHHYLVNHFLSPLYNRREDRYGGSFGNRLRFLAEILEGMRAATRPGFVLGVRLSADIGPGGIDSEAMLAIGRALQDRGLVDFVGFSLGGRTPEAFPLMTGGMERPAGYELPWNELPSRGLTLPTLVTGRYRTLEEADEAVASGTADLIGMTRAHIADPELVRKTMSGRAARVRPCIGCNECQRSIITEGSVRCAVNPSLPGAGTTTDLPHPTRRARRVTVVGGGPAGLEAARAAALAGHTVTLFEETEELGGIARRAARAMPNAPGMLDAIAWSEREVRGAGVDVRLGTRASAETVLATVPDVVVAATGSVPRQGARQTARPGATVAGADLPHVVSSRDVLALTTVPETAVVVDEIGEYEALGVAELLVEAGAHVTFVTPFASVGLPVDATGRASTALGRLRAHGRFTALPLSMVVAITTASVDIEDLLGHTVSTHDAGLVVMVTRATPSRPSWAEDLGVPVEYAGDAVLPRSYRTAVREGYLAATRIEELCGTARPARGATAEVRA
ncbi:FAD-dependent oxidoreductase [Streptomyces hirsutus]|uniref:FAD-dependent oxidoreductase n=1 Tax=Streptomyces hirsutus TaxID=35620 RepID=A0ABZ1GHA7_9ACTN|nr:FAD-dependent oxidoreductase [Streptomyces hirsutus]WSD04579.1 FAD-dependent oxidoreductase [Streptomyces hirsutus]WTD22030.1 FAD-dependent oxidoreductase [Streptomyces hirsutus]WTD79410.1 FAD-dependent oxidoreductase [Streptomyces sp. NBC_01635]